MRGGLSRYRLAAFFADLRRRLPRPWRVAVKEPLLHFLVIGLTLFAGHYALNPTTDRQLGRHDIYVDEQALLRFVSFRTKSFDEERTRAYMMALPPPALSRLIDDFVEEEVKYREARAWGLDTDDYVIRRRLVQSLEFVTRSAVESGSSPGEAELRRYYDDHRALYAGPATLTFTHVFFSADNRGWGEARRLARSMLATLSEQASASGDGPWPGDRFLYFLNYVDQGPDLVRSHFGQPMADQLFQLKADPEQWQGPYESPYGVHLVRVMSSRAGGALPFEQVRSQVARDFTEDEARARLQAVLGKLASQYRVHLARDLAVAGKGR